jgi:hypothetical protein
MTIDDVEPTTVAPPRPVRRPPSRGSAPRRPAAPPRKVTEPSDTITLTHADLEAMMQKVAAKAAAEAVAPFRAQVPGFIESEPPPLPRARQAAPEEMTAFEARMAAKTPGHVLTPKPQQNYNHKLKWFARPDGAIVQLQGSPQARALYADLGFHCLDDEEVVEWEGGEQARTVAGQDTKAALINGLRKLVSREAVLSGYVDDNVWDASLNIMAVARLEEEWRDLCGQTNKPNRRLPTAERYRQEQDPNAGLLVGVETGRSPEDLQRKLSAPGAQTRTVEVTHENAEKFRYA